MAGTIYVYSAITVAVYLQKVLNAGPLCAAVRVRVSVRVRIRVSVRVRVRVRKAFGSSHLMNM